MYSLDGVEFTTDAPMGADVTIDDSTKGKEQLLKALAIGLAFPDYFGENWDALIDCLGNLSWLIKPEVIIDHPAVPDLPEPELKLYLESLIDALARRTSDGRPRVRVLFRVKDRPRIASALASTVR